MCKSRSQRLAGWFVLVTGVALTAGSMPSAANQPIATYHGDNARTGFSTDSSLTSANVGTLKQKWDIAGTSTISAQAIVAERFRLLGRLEWRRARYEQVRQSAVGDLRGTSTQTAIVSLPPRCSRGYQLSHGWER